MPVSTLSILDPGSLDQFIDLRSVPRLRYFRANPTIERFRRAVPFDYIFVSGLDVDHYRFGEGFSIDTDLPPAYIEAYDSEQLYRIDPFIQAAKSSITVVIEQDVYKKQPAPDRLAYLQQHFGVVNRTVFPIVRDQKVYGVVGFTRSTPFEDEEIAFLAQMSSAIHRVMTKPLMDKYAAEHLRLSKGELACLQHASLGLTSAAIGKATGYQLDTVNTYLISAAKKLKASNRTQAIAEAIRLQVIS